MPPKGKALHQVSNVYDDQNQDTQIQEYYPPLSKSNCINNLTNIFVKIIPTRKLDPCLNSYYSNC